MQHNSTNKKPWQMYSTPTNPKQSQTSVKQNET